MAARQPNHRLVKIHLSYTVEEVASLLGVHRNTVRQWIKQGLDTVDRRRPTLIRGRVLAGYLQERRVRNKRTCKQGEIYCVRCRVPQTPDGRIAEYKPTNATLGWLIGICPGCSCMLYRRVNPADLERIRGNLEISMPRAPRLINERASPFVNCDFDDGATDHGRTQPR